MFCSVIAVETARIRRESFTSVEMKRAAGLLSSVCVERIKPAGEPVQTLSIELLML